MSTSVVPRNPDPAGDARREMEILGLLAAGRNDAVLARVAELRAGPWGSDPRHRPFLLLAELDAKVRSFAAGWADLNEVRPQIELLARDEPWLRWWLHAVTAECILLDGDIEAVFHTCRVLEDMPTDNFADSPVLYMRGRLRRMASLALLVHPILGEGSNLASGDEPAVALRNAAIADLQRCGYRAEVALTRAGWATTSNVTRWDEPRHNLVRVMDARADVGDDEDSYWPLYFDAMVALVAFSAGDAEVGFRMLTHLEATAPDDSLLCVLPRVCRNLMVALFGGPIDPALKAMDEDLARLRTAHARLVPGLQASIAHTLADRGIAAATRFAVPILDLPTTTPAGQLELRVLEMRMRILAGTLPTADTVMAVLVPFEADTRRKAGGFALRLAHDLAHQGAIEDASALRAWGLERVPPAGELSGWETAWARPLEPPSSDGRAPLSAPSSPLAGAGAGAGPGVGPAAPVTLSVLAPVLELRHGEELVEVRETVAKLLLALVVAHPSPLHIEQASDLLWPESSFAAGRRRLNTVVHRLRQVFGSGASVVRRTGDVLVFDPAGLDIDLLRFRQALAGGADARAAAVVAPRGNLCHVQFPYDDHLIDARRDIRALWLEAARELARSGAVDGSELHAAMVSLELTADDLGA